MDENKILEQGLGADEILEREGTLYADTREIGLFLNNKCIKPFSDYLKCIHCYPVFCLFYFYVEGGNSTAFNMPILFSMNMFLM